MNKDENKSIHEFDFNLICEYFASIERQGPGSSEMTKLALSFINNINSDSRIADLGCGTGSSALLLAQATNAKVSALDLFPLFIEKLKSGAEKLNLGERIEGIVGSMDNLPFAESSLDVIWSEGAIYNIGFRHGLEYWKSFLKPDGFFAISEACWLTDERPDEIEKFWLEAYPEIDTIPNKIAQIQAAGYIPTASFILPEECWTKNYYLRQNDAQRIFLSKHQGNRTAEELVENMRHEAELYSKYNKFYGYVFFIGKKL